MTLVEYGDYECPHCAATHPVLKQLLAEMIGQFRFVFRHFPLGVMHPHAARAAEAAEAAGAQGKFWEMHERLFAAQQNLEPAQLLDHARALGLDEAQFESDLAQRRHLSRVQEDFRGGIRSGVNGTPTFFLNNIRHNAGYDLATLAAALRRAARV